MPKYRVLTKSFINNAIVEEGDLVDYDGEASENLELVEPAKVARKKASGAETDTELA